MDQDIIRDSNMPLIMKVVDLSDLNHIRLCVIVYRLFGLSYEQIGTFLGITKQAVYKHMENIKAKDPLFHQFLKHCTGRAVEEEEFVSAVFSPIRGSRPKVNFRRKFAEVCKLYKEKYKDML